jgi:ribosomal protein S18 acetylase RimI-like enzyme
VLLLGFSEKRLLSRIKTNVLINRYEIINYRWLAKVNIRKFRDSDINDLVKILELNMQYGSPLVEGPDAMRRVARCQAAVVLVAEENGTPVGFIRAIYDGSRALIHLLSVNPKFQRKGIGSQLVDAAIFELVKRGAPSISVTVTEESVGFWEKKDFKRLPVFLMLKTLKEP